jgi:dTMP kinase
MSNDGIFLMVDGIDGAGKSTIVRTWINHLKDKGNLVLNLKDYWSRNEFPSKKKIKKHDVVVSAEPTSIWTGSAIRQELIQDKSDYPTKTIAQAFALDRFVLYKKVILPALQEGKIVLQDRGVSTSLCYQSLESDLSIKQIAAIEGNKFTLNNLPDLLLITDVDIKEALGRLDDRTDKKDNSEFERKKFLQQARAKFLSDGFQQHFKPDTEIRELDCNDGLGIIKQKSRRILEDFIN